MSYYRYLILFLIIQIAILLNPCKATAENYLNFLSKTFTDTVDVNYWSKNLQEGITIEQGFPTARTIFERRGLFENARFKSLTSFFMNKFNGNAEFTAAEFDSVAQFNGAVFNANANYGLAYFHSDSYFSRATFNGMAIFYGINFLGLTDFRQTTFQDKTQFGGTQFKNRVDFASSRFNAVADFENTSFERYVDFHNTQFLDSCKFYNATMPESLDFRSVILTHELDLTFCNRPRSGEKCKIALFGTDLSKIKIDLNIFEIWFPEKNHPFLPACTLRSKDKRLMFGTWIVISDQVLIPTPTQKGGFYEKLLQKLKDDGFLQSYEIVDKEYRWFTQDSLGDWGEKIKYQANLW